MGSFLVEFPNAVYSADSLTRAAYVVMRFAEVTIDQVGDTWRCSIKPVGNKPLSDAEIESMFRREVIDQHLRLKLEAQTEPLRTAILGLAFSRTDLQGE